jgi:Metal binding domain of Ada
MARTWTLIGPDGRPFESDRPGTLGGHRRSRIYGRLDCPAALRAIARGGYVSHRVFFLNEEHAKGAGYRPCAVCLPTAYARWKAKTPTEPSEE